MGSGQDAILIVAGEASGEMYGAELVEALQQDRLDRPFRFFGCGGHQMEKAGVDILVDIEKTAVLGPLEAAAHLFHYLSAMKRLLRETLVRRAVLAILIDFPDFNLRLAEKLKTLGIQVVYFVSPQIWAWRTHRVHQVKRSVDSMLVILPFEVEFYARFGVRVDYVGHPLVDRVKPTLDRAAFCLKYHLDPEGQFLSLLPGSRAKEIRYNLPILLHTARRIAWERPVHFLIPVASAGQVEKIQSLIQEETPDLPVTLVPNDAYNAIWHSRLAVVSSGTATLEAALLEVPLISVFRISNLTWIAGQYLVDVPYYCLVNLIAGEEIVPELFQQDFTEERLWKEIRRFLDDEALCNHVKMKLSSVREKLGTGGAIHRAADKIREMLKGNATGSTGA
jgi:lipid-A-disaccharide synthase